MSHIEQFNNNGVPYLRVCEGRYVSSLKRQKKVIIKNLGPLSKYDDGKPDFLKRFREKFKKGEIVFKYKSRINEIELTYRIPDGPKSKKNVKEKEIIYWSKKHYEKELHQNKKFIEYLEVCKENPDK